MSLSTLASRRPLRGATRPKTSTTTELMTGAAGPGIVCPSSTADHPGGAR